MAKKKRQPKNTIKPYKPEHMRYVVTQDYEFEIQYEVWQVGFTEEELSKPIHKIPYGIHLKYSEMGNRGWHSCFVPEGQIIVLVTSQMADVLEYLLKVGLNRFVTSLVESL